MRKIYSIFLFLILTLNLLIFVPFNVVGEAIYDDHLQIDWDDFAPGLTSGSGTFYDFERIAGDDFYVATYYVNSSPKSLRVGQLLKTVDETTDSGNINFNFSPLDNITDFQMFFSQYTGFNYHSSGSDIYQYVRFYADIDCKIILRLHTWSVPPNFFASWEFYNYSSTSWEVLYNLNEGEMHGTNPQYDDWYIKLTPQFNDDKNLFKIVLWNELGGTRATLYEELSDGIFTSFDKIYFSNIAPSNGYYSIFSGIGMYVDDIIVWIGDYTPSEGEVELGDLNFKLYDKETADLLTVFGKFANMAYLIPYDPAISTKIYSDLWVGDYDNYGQFGTTVSLTNLDISDNGEWHYFNFTTIAGYVDGETKIYLNSTNYLKVYPDQIYDIIIIPDDYTGEPDFTNCHKTNWGWPFGSWNPGMCTDKYTYAYGETLLLTYIFPPKSWMHGIPGYPVNGWKLEIQDTDGWIPQTIHTFYQEQGHFDFTGNWMANLNWVVDDSTGHEESYKSYRLHLYHDNWFSPSINGPTYICTGDEFEPSGDIVSITPSDPYLGQSISVLFTANNTGRMNLKHLASGEILDNMEFTKFTGIRSAAFMPDRPGSYLVSLYVDGYAGETLVDTDSFDLNGTGGTQGDYGYNVEYLEVPEYICIAGYDNVTIYYNTFNNNTKLEILTPRGETSIYSSNLSDGWGMYIIDTPNSMSIGTWNVTMYGSETLQTSFNIIAQEGNWVEFLQNIYYDDELFTLHVKHTKRVVLVFYKNDVPQGIDFRMEDGWQTNNNIIIPSENQILTPGSWKVEMWQVNDWVREKLLATWECRVISRMGAGITEGGYDDIFSILAGGADSIAGGGFGLAFMAIIFVLAAIVSMAALKLKNDVIFFGAIIMALFMAFIGWLPIWIVVIAIILAGLLFSSAFSKKLKIGG